MGENTGTRWLNYTQAAARVKRDRNSIRRWGRQGMPMSWRTGADGNQERVVREDVLLEWFRGKLQASPVHFYRIRKRAIEQGLPEPELPAHLSRAAKRVPSENVQSSGGNEEKKAVSATRPEIDPLADMKPILGAVEYRALSEALKTEPTGCRNDDRFTSDRLEARELPELAAICATCPVLELCTAYARAARPDEGFWAGAPARHQRVRGPVAASQKWA
ncbi:WhiB family transcriptional regulator [Microbacterium phosphatis]|uniref:WhiB family transcriptional regulator n=1 Tax=Microbacterium phosphatis TaxID=3140248 RepID=UPI00314045CB